MAITIRDVVSGSGQGTSHLLAAFASNPIVGDTIVVCVGVYQLSGSILTPTDSFGNAYTQLGTTVTNSIGSVAMFYAPNVVGGATFRVTMRLQNVLHYAVVAWALTGTAAAPYNGDVRTGFGTSNPTNSGPSTVTPAPNSIFLGALSQNGPNGIINMPGWNTQSVNGFTAAMNSAANVADYAAHFDVFTAYKISSTVEEAQWNVGVGWELVQASFAPVGGGGGGGAGGGSRRFRSRYRF